MSAATPSSAFEHTTDRPVSPETSSPWTKAAVGMSLVSAVFLLVVGGLMTADYLRRAGKDPLDCETFQKLKAQVVQEPGNDALRKDLRAMDLDLRREYFQQRSFTARGVWLLVGGALTLVLLGRWTAMLLRCAPLPEPVTAPVDTDARTGRFGRWAVGALAVGLVGLGATLAATVGTALDPGAYEVAVVTPDSPLPGATEQGDGKTAAAPAGAIPVAAGPGGSSGKVAASSSADYPSAEEVARNWPYFRGPFGSGIAADGKAPTSWNAEKGEGILWKAPVALEGHSSPVLWGDRIFVTGASEQKRQVYCYDASSGKMLWQHDVRPLAGPPRKLNPDTGLAASTPATDGRRVYAIFPNGDVTGVGIDGKQVWARNLGMPDNTYGHASSLVMYRNLLLVQFDQAAVKDGKSKMLALDAATGKTVWEKSRPVANSWPSPIVVDVKGQPQLITASDPWAMAYNPADGAELWRAKCLKLDVGPSPVYADGVVYVVSEHANLSAIRADGQGDVTKSHVGWQGEDNLPDTCSPLVTSQYVLVLASSGTLTCYQVGTGEKLWEKEYEDTSFKASPGLAGDLVYLVDEKGKTWIEKPGPKESKTVAQCELGEPCSASPVFFQGKLYLRGKKHLFCLGKKGDSPR